MKKDESLKTEPDFRFIGRDGNKSLYDAEERAFAAIHALARVRGDKYNEDMYKCAVPEALYVLLDHYGPDSAEKTILAWLRRELPPGRFRPEFNVELLDKLAALLDEMNDLRMHLEKQHRVELATSPTSAILGGFERDEPHGPRINANVVSGLLRHEWNRLKDLHGLGPKTRTDAECIEQLLPYSRQIISGLTDVQVIKIAKGDADLVGVSPGPIEYVEKKT